MAGCGGLVANYCTERRGTGTDPPSSVYICDQVGSSVLNLDSISCVEYEI